MLLVLETVNAQQKATITGDRIR